MSKQNDIEFEPIPKAATMANSADFDVLLITDTPAGNVTVSDPNRSGLFRAVSRTVKKAFRESAASLHLATGQPEFPDAQDDLRLIPYNTHTEEFLTLGDWTSRPPIPGHRNLPIPTRHYSGIPGINVGLEDEFAKAVFNRIQGV